MGSFKDLKNLDTRTKNFGGRAGYPLQVRPRAMLYTSGFSLLSRADASTKPSA